MDFDLGKMQQMLSQAQAMKSQMDERLEEVTVEADAGGGAVVARMNGNKRLLAVRIAPSAAQAAAGDISLLEDLIVAAVNAASGKAEEAQKSSASSMLGGMLPGF